MRVTLTGLLAVVLCSAAGDKLAAAEAAGNSAQPVVLRVEIQNEPITPVTVRFLRRALEEASRADASCLVIELDTPGGVLDSTQRIVTDILASPVPVVVYVSPSGARAASAGVFITLASHVAAMAPGTRIGAAHPVQIGGFPITPGRSPTSPSDESEKEETSEDQPKEDSPGEEKIVNDTVAWARGLAQLRGRNADWAALAVRESRVLTDSEAIRDGVVDLVAADIKDLLGQIDGREVDLSPGTKWASTVRLRTGQAQVRTLSMWWGEQLLAVISNPNVALLLMMFGVYGILFEMYSPGWGVAGTLGVVSLVLGFFGMSVLPINYAGLALIAIALGMFVAEAFVTSFGALTIGGIVCLILGGTMLVDSPGGFLTVSMWVLVPVAVATGLITAFLVGSVVKAHQRGVQTGGEGLMGSEAVARDAFLPDGTGFKGQVFVRGEWWRARSPSPVAAGERLRVGDRDGLTLIVRQDAGDIPSVRQRPEPNAPSGEPKGG